MQYCEMNYNYHQPPEYSNYFPQYVPYDATTTNHSTFHNDREWNGMPSQQFCHGPPAPQYNLNHNNHHYSGPPARYSAPCQNVQNQSNYWHQTNQTNKNNRHWRAPNRKASNQSTNSTNCENQGTLLCEPCERNFTSANALAAHLKTHIQCEMKGCSYIASSKAVKLHFVQTHAEGKFRINLQTPDDIQKWREERKRNWPTHDNIAKKKRLEEENVKAGIHIQTKEFVYRERENKRGLGRGRKNFIHEKRNRNYKKDNTYKHYDENFTQQNTNFSNNTTNENINSNNHDNSTNDSNNKPNNNISNTTTSNINISNVDTCNSIKLETHSNDNPEEVPCKSINSSVALSLLQNYDEVDDDSDDVTNTENRAQVKTSSIPFNTTPNETITPCDKIDTPVSSPTNEATAPCNKNKIPMSTLLNETVTPSNENGTTGTTYSNETHAPCNKSETESSVGIKEEKEDGELSDEGLYNEVPSTANSQDGGPDGATEIEGTTYHPSQGANRRKNNRRKKNQRKADLNKNTNETPQVSLLEMLLAKEIRHERNVILQCVRYIVNEKFFQSF